jgi:FKBP-type peptidyl-prolyl cis-trans isomerase 2
MKTKNGDKVKVHYTGKLENGEVFDSSRDSQPLEFTVGEGNVIAGFDKAVLDMEIGDKKSVEIAPDEAYGSRSEELVVAVKRSEFPDHIEPSIGQRLQMQQPEGDAVNLVITDMNDDTVTLDANHPLAGMTLVFDVEMMEIE